MHQYHHFSLYLPSMTDLLYNLVICGLTTLHAIDRHFAIHARSTKNGPARPVLEFLVNRWCCVYEGLFLVRTVGAQDIYVYIHMVYISI